MDLEIRKMNDEIIELREDNQRLQKMCSIVEQMNDILSETINECNCSSRQTFETKTKTKLNILRDKYQQLKDTEIHFSPIIDKPRSVSSQSVIKRVSINDGISDLGPITQILISNDKQNLLTIEDINDSLYRVNDEEVNLGFVLPKIETNEDHFHQSKPIKTQNKKNSKKMSKKLNKTKTSSKTSNQLKDREKRVSCHWPGCQMKFRDTYNMSVHMLRHTGHKSFICCNPDCHKSYATKAALEVHLNTHLDNRRFKCQYSECGASFIRKTQLKVHISQSHTRDYPYKCNWPGCEYQGCYLNRLNSHRLSHTGIKPFKCDWKGCDTSFRLNHHLKAHMLKHTGEKPIPCQLSSCDKRFQSKQAMKIHLERTHSKPFVS